MAHSEELADPIRDLGEGGDVLTGQRMFGKLAFLVNGQDATKAAL